MRKSGLIAIALFAAWPGASMAQTKADGASPPASDTPASEKRICKKSKVTGSLTRTRRTCATKAQWDQEEERARRSIDAIDMNGWRRVGKTRDPFKPADGTFDGDGL